MSYDVESISRRTVRARRSHLCDCCDTTIQPGEHYERQVCKYDGQLYNWRTCTDCVAIASSVHAWYLGSDAVDSGAFREWAQEFQHDPEQPGARAYLDRSNAARDAAEEQRRQHLAATAAA